MPAILDWRPADPPDDLVRQTAQALADGTLVALPTEAGYVLAADPARIADPRRPAGLPDGLDVARLDGFFEPAEFFVRAPDATAAERALATRLWPGPVGLVHGDAPFPAWVPAHPVAGAVLAARAGPLALFELDGGRAIDPGALGDAVSLVVTDGRVRTGPVTRLRVNGAKWVVERPGVLSEAAVREALARRIVFICTGNTCRSPMAEGVFKARLAERMGCGVDDLPARGYLVTSAGISAVPGDPATPESAGAVRDFGVDLSSHRSRLATAELVARADDVIAMTRAHLLTLVGRYPVVGGSLRLFCGADGDLDDPIGGGPDVYRACAAAVRHHVDRLIIEMGLP
jgi:protein arginine phosphatase